MIRLRRRCRGETIRYLVSLCGTILKGLEWDLLYFLSILPEEGSKDGDGCSDELILPLSAGLLLELTGICNLVHPSAWYIFELFHACSCLTEVVEVGRSVVRCLRRNRGREGVILILVWRSTRRDWESGLHQTLFTFPELSELPSTEESKRNNRTVMG